MKTLFLFLSVYFVEFSSFFHFIPFVSHTHYSVSLFFDYFDFLLFASAFSFISRNDGTPLLSLHQYTVVSKEKITFLSSKRPFCKGIAILEIINESQYIYTIQYSTVQTLLE